MHEIKHLLNLTTHSNTIVGPSMVICIGLENVRGVATAALIVCVILSRTVLPDQIVINMRLTTRVAETQETTRDNGYWVFQIRNTSEGIDMRIDVVCESVITHAGKTITVVRDCSRGYLGSEEYRVDKRQSGAQRVSYCRDGVDAIGRKAGLDGSKDF